MLDITEKKNLLRKEYIRIRNDIEEKEIKSNIIFNKVIHLDDYKTAKVIAIYKSFKTEVDTTNLINYSLENKKLVVLPRVVGDELVFYRINSLEDKFEISKFGVEEPIENKDNQIDPKDIDLIVLPGLCFDMNKNRLGFGKAYYDRFLSKTKSKNIAICFDEQIIKDDNLPTIESDIKVQKIVTDKSIY